MIWFSIPEGYSCVTRQNDTTLYAYKDYNTRDTFTLNGLVWQHTATSNYSGSIGNNVCVTAPQIPSSFLTGGLVAGTLVVLCAFNMIYKMIRRVYL